MPAGAKNGGTETKLLSEIAYEKLKGAIITTELAPGQEVTESFLAQEFGLGKAPLRHALTRLAHEGLVESQNRRGYLIAPLTLKDVHDIWACRFLLEVEATRLAAGQVDEEYLRGLDRICKKGYEAGDRASQEAYLAANREFHLAIYRASGNAHLAGIVERLIDQMSRMLFLGILATTSAEEWEHGHSALIEALVAGEGDRAAGIMKAHLESSQRAVLEAALKSPALMQVNLY